MKKMGLTTVEYKEDVVGYEEDRFKNQMLWRGYIPDIKTKF